MEPTGVYQVMGVGGWGRGIPWQLQEASTRMGRLGLWHQLCHEQQWTSPRPTQDSRNYRQQLSLFTVRTVLTIDKISGCRDAAPCLLVKHQNFSKK